MALMMNNSVQSFFPMLLDLERLFTMLVKMVSDVGFFA